MNLIMNFLGKYSVKYYLLGSAILLAISIIFFHLSVPLVYQVAGGLATIVLFYLAVLWMYNPASESAVKIPALSKNWKFLIYFLGGAAVLAVLHTIGYTPLIPFISILVITTFLFVFGVQVYRSIKGVD